MSKKTISMVMTGLMVISGFLGFITFESTVVSAGVTIYVGSGPGNDTTSIQDAIDNFANPGDTVFVYSGVYTENIMITKTINLTGEDKQTTIIDGGGGTGVVIFSTDWVNVTGFTITNGTRGVEINSFSDYNSVVDNNIDNHAQYGVLITNTNSNNSIIKNTINNTQMGIYLWNSNINNTIIKNTVSNSSSYGIYLWVSNSNNKIYQNNFIDNVNQAFDDDTNFWDDGYPNGGNFWDDYSGGDNRSGPGQIIPGNDGIGDAVYNIAGGTNKDNYPLWPNWNALELYKPYPGRKEVIEYAIGSVKVAVIFMESNGSIDGESENWSSPRKSMVISEIQDALTWWEGLEVNASLSFSILDVGGKNTSYEPITRPHTDDNLWIGDIMEGMGYSSGTYLEKVQSYNNWLREQYNTDWAYTILVADSFNDTDGNFSDLWSGYGYWSYGCVVMTYDNGEWGISRMNNVTAHETGHMFYATDEYNLATEYNGYLNEADVEGSGGLMNNNNLVLSSGTRLQIGWRDTDNDGIMDILDTEPNTYLVSYKPDPTMDNTPTYTGYVVVVPYPNNNPSGSGRDVTLNTISDVEYRIDGGSWTNALPVDGTFDDPVETFQFTATHLSPGVHFVEARAINSVNNNDSTYANDTITILPDNEPPEIWETTLDIPAAGDYYNITVDAVDNVDIDTVWLEYTITSSDGYYETNNVSMNLSMEPSYWYEVNIWSNATWFNYTIKCNDTSDNWNGTSSMDLAFRVHNLDTGEGFMMIQVAIDDPDTLDGHRIYVDNGTYHENVVVNKSINLTGENKDTTLIDGGGGGIVVRVERNWVNVTGFTITNGSTGIEIMAGTNFTLIGNNNITSNNLYGIHLRNSSNHNIIKNNIIYSNAYSGIYLDESSQNDVSGNYVTNSVYAGINLTSSSNYNDIKNNNVTMNNQDGIHLDSSSNYNGISYNNISNNWDGIYLVSVSNNNITNNNVYLNNDDGINLYIDSNFNNISNNNVYLNNDDGILLYTSSNNTITGNDIWNNLDGMYIYLSSNDNIISYNNVYLHDNFFNSGIYLRWTSNNNITNNNVTDNNFGIYFRDSSNGNMISNNASNNYYGIYLRDSSNCNITSNIASNNSWGIFMRGGDDNNVINNNASNNEIGIRIRAVTNNNISSNDLYSNTEDGIYITSDSTHNMVMGNNISDTNDGIAIFPRFNWRPNQNYIIGNTISNAQIGIHLYYVPTNTIKGNTMLSCGIVIEGDQLSQWNEHHIDTDNTVNGKPVYYWKNQTFGVVPTDGGEVILANCTDIIIVVLEATDGSVGIELGFSRNNNIINNNISSNSWAGIYLWDSDDNDITDNTISSNDQYGIRLHSSSDLNYITNNYISNGENGVYLLNSDGNNITGNNISNNDYGLYLNISNDNDIVGNNIFSNSIYGIYLVSSVNNDIYHNNIMDNFNQAYDDSNESNIWNLTYSGGGNYWSDFSPTCPDLYSGAITPQTIGSPDGICDFQYDIDADSTDYYPLKAPWDLGNSAPSAPLTLTANGSVTYVNITWNPPISDGGLPITHYRVYRSNISGGEIFYVEIGDILYYNDTNVIGGDTYYYHVSAVNILGEGPLSNEDNATPLAFPDAPTGLASSSGDSYVNLTWNAPSLDGGSPIINYTIYRGIISGGEIFWIMVGNVTYFNDTNVTNGFKYFYYVSANNTIGEGPFSVETNATPVTLPNAPTGLAATAGDSYVNITWVAPFSDGGSPIINYTIYKGTISGGESFLTMVGNVTYFNDTNVTNGVPYYYKVSAKNAIGEGPLSNGANDTPLGPPFDPQNLQSSFGDSYVYLSWEAPAFDGGSPVTNYRIYRGTTSGGEIFLTEIGDILYFNDTIVTNGFNYYYRVTAVSSVGEGPQSNEVSAFPAAVPGAPTDLSATPGDSYVRLSWVSPGSYGGSPITNYIIYKGTTSGTTTFFIEIGDTLSYDDTTVSNGVTYYYKVSAKNAIGEGPSSNEANAKPLGLPSLPQNLQVSSGDSYVNISWEVPASDGGSSITNYIIYRGTTSDGETFLTEINNVLYFNDTTITNGVVYFYKVRAKNAVGEGPLSDEATATPLGSPSAPQNLQASVGDSILNISWDTPISNGGSPVIKYRIYRGTTSGEETFLAEVGDISYYKDSGLTNGISYYYKVSAVNAIGEGSLSNEINGTPDQDSDGDGVLDFEDDDDDNDDILDENDAFPLNPEEWLDTDSDGTGNNADTDDDDDGLSDDMELEMDTDPLNPDSDGDSHLDGEDAYPLDPNKWKESKEADMTLIWILLLLIIIVVIIVLMLVLRKRGERAKEMPAFEKELPPPPGEIKETVPEGEETGSAEWEEEPKGEIEEEERTVSEKGKDEVIEDEEDLPALEDTDEETSP